MDEIEQFIRQIAALTMDGEEVDGTVFILENDDAVSTLHSLIRDARTLLTVRESKDHEAPS